MKKNKIITCSYDESEQRVQPFLDEGWRVSQISNENVYISSSGGGYGSSYSTVKGKITFILEK